MQEKPAGRISLMDKMVIDPEKVSNIIEEFLRKKLAEGKKDGILLGLSGGLDSAVSATLAARAAGPSNVYALHLFDRETQPRFTNHARNLAGKLGINLEISDITEAIREQGTYQPLTIRTISLYATLNRVLVFLFRKFYGAVFRENPYILSLKEGGKSARKRGSSTRNYYNFLAGTVGGGFNTRHIQRKRLLEDYAARKNLLLIGSANRSEAFVGWFVKDGVDDLPVETILGLYKNQVRQLARFLEVPAGILREAPSPDMMKGIKDEDIIGHRYDNIDKVAYVLEHGLGEETAVANGVSRREFGEIKKINQLSEWKRANEHEFPDFFQRY